MPRFSSPRILRLLGLREVFTRARMERAWKASVRPGLRRQTQVDMHDYLDVHRNLGPYLDHLRADVITGRHRPAEAALTRLEKQNGITRRIPLPSPSDAIVLQTIVDALEPRIKRWQPTRSAFYSRSHRAPSVEDLDASFSYPWWELWPEFQSRIWSFSVQFPYTVVTDVATYYDTIPLGSLRHAIASLGRFRQDVLDLLFYMLEAFIWRPEYIPLTGVGLPQLNFDAPRLLAHAYLFPVDRLLKRLTSNNFVRWMDDIDFGVPSIADGKEILGQVDNLLNMYGVRLNPAKTKILTDAQAAHYFWIQENRQLTILTNVLRYGSHTTASALRVRAHLHSRFPNFYASPREGHWAKVLKRYITAFGKLKDSVLEPEVPTLLAASPDLRGAIFQYYLSLGYSRLRYKHIKGYMFGGECVDDASLFQAAHLLVRWHIPVSDATRRDAAQLAWRILRQRPASVVGVVAGLWLMSKYGSARQMASYVKRTEKIWKRSEWAARQIAAASPRLTANQVQQLRRSMSSAGLLQGLHVLTNLDEISILRAVDQQLSSYLRQIPTPPYPYDHAKVILALNVFRGQLATAAKKKLHGDVSALVTDTVHQELLIAVIP